MKIETGLMGNFWSVLVATMLVLVCLFAAPLASAQTRQVSFNHDRTGFPLVGAHAREQCDACHNKGIFKGTPKQCVSCHVKGSQSATTFKQDKHVPTRDACSLCHNSFSWSPARMSHNTVVSGTCVSCHNGAFVSEGADGRTANHPAISGLPNSQTERCDTCHRSTTSWIANTHLHGAGDQGKCSSCHNGRRAVGVNNGHIPTNLTAGNCDNCHTSFIAFSPASMNHTGTAGKCASCHNGSFVGSGAIGLPTGHIATGGANCDSSGCHSGTTHWNVNNFSHPGRTIGDHSCVTCHGAGTGDAGLNINTATHIPTGSANCDDCHKSFTTFAPALMDHAVVASVTCITCHSGTYISQGALGKTSAHIPLVPASKACSACHTGFDTFEPATMDHSGTAGQCASCHNGAYLAYNAQGKTTSHVVTSAACDACHLSTTSWATVNYDHSVNNISIGSGNCATCHVAGGSGLSKPTTHIPSTATCDSCHTSFASFKSLKMNHSGLTDCTVCHNGSFVYANALAKAADHIPTSRNCDFCHSNFTAFAPAQMNHALDSSSKCATCHNGNFTGSNAQTKTANHVSTTAQCDTCHLSTTTWATVTYMHAGGDTACSTCHTAGGSGLSKQAGHIPTSQQCSVCHTNPIGKTGGYSFAYTGASLMDHTGATDCASCHNGSYLSQGVTGALAKSATHLLTSSQCSTCHTNTSNYTTWAGVTYNHTGVVAGTCANCHNGAQATGKSNLHIPTSVACDTCHTNYTAFIPATMNHANAGYGLNTHTCSSCHNGGFTGANAQAKSANHVATTAECDTCHTSLTSWATVTYDHAANGISIGGHTCANAGCHTSGGSGLTMPTTHITPPSGAYCDSCHTNFTAFRPAVMSHTGVTTCTSCHNGSFVSQGTTGALAKHSGHIPTTADCVSCHTGYVTFQNGLSAANHAAMTGPVATGNCSTCHSGAYTMSTGTVPGKTAGHIPTSRQCDACHASTAANGFVTPAPTTANIHVGVAGLCSNCHNGGYSVTSGNLYGKHALHEVTSAQCDTCHTNTMSYTTWTGAGHTHTAADQNLCGVSCHTGNTGQAGTAKPATGHIPTTATCGNCHNTTTFNPATMSHTNTAGPLATVGAHTCSQCHSGTYVAQGALAKTTGHVATTAECDTCHLTTTTWATVSYTHASTDTVCDTCHKSGGSGLSKPSSHIPTTAQCSTCHTNPIGKTAGTYNFGYSSTSLMNHTGATACSTCHSGSYTSQGIIGALGKPSGTSHIPTTAQCSLCHKSFTTFAKSGGGMTMDHTGLTGCKSCHISTYVAQGLQTNPNDAVHTSGGVTASSVQCSVCHTNTLSYTTWNGGLYHKGATTTTASGTCTTCHNGTVSGADDDPSNHSLINTGLLNGSTFRNTCNNCHTIVSSWTVSKLGASGHNNSQGNGSGSCKVCHNTGATFPGSLQKKTQGNHEGSNASGDCSMSGCHRPLGNEGSAYSAWD